MKEILHTDIITLFSYI